MVDATFYNVGSSFGRKLNPYCYMNAIECEHRFAASYYCGRKYKVNKVRKKGALDVLSRKAGEGQKLLEEGKEKNLEMVKDSDESENTSDSSFHISEDSIDEGEDEAHVKKSGQKLARGHPVQSDFPKALVKYRTVGFGADELLLDPAREQIGARAIAAAGVTGFRLDKMSKNAPRALALGEKFQHIFKTLLEITVKEPVFARLSASARGDLVADIYNRQE